MLRNYYKKVIATYGYAKERPFLSKAIDIMEDLWEKKNLFIIEAPTGYGKTTITATLSLKAYDEKNKLIIALPLRTLLEDQFNKLRTVIRDHKALGKRYMHEHTSPYLIKPITLTTIDTLSLTMFGIAPEDLSKVARGWDEWSGTLQGTAGHYIFSWSSVMLSDIILDEAHLLVDETKSLTYLIALIKHMIENQQHVLLMSATIPGNFEKIITRYLSAYSNKIETIKFEDGKDQYVVDKLNKVYELKIAHLPLDKKYDVILNWIKEEKLNGLNRILVVFNTVNDAIKFYNRLDCKNKLLIHSRFSSEDRQHKYEKLLDLKEKSDEYIIVGTQAIEAGIDISSTLLITELAPLNSLIQRFGRFLRYEEKFGKAYIWYEDATSKDMYKVYQMSLCKGTLDLLVNNPSINLHLPYAENGYKTLIDQLYKDVISLPSETETQIKNMLNTFLNLDTISNAIDLFFELEGSFVRKSFTIPIRTPDIQEPIPIDYALFRKLLENGRIKHVVIQDDERPVDDKIRERFMNTKKAIRYLYRMGITSFIVDATYDSEYGLQLEEENHD